LLSSAEVQQQLPQGLLQWVEGLAGQLMNNASVSLRESAVQQLQGLLALHGAV
jgi:hypothetical protein